MRGWDSILDASRQKNPIWREAKKSQPKSSALKTNTNAFKKDSLSETLVAMNDGFCGYTEVRIDFKFFRQDGQ